MRTFRKCLNLFFVLCLTVGLVGLPTAAAHAQGESALTSPSGMLNPDGTLKLDGSFSGNLNLEGWNVALDPKRGPVLSPQASSVTGGDWQALGNGNGMVNSTVSAMAITVDGVYVGGSFGEINNTPGTQFLAKWTGTTWEGVGSGPYGGDSSLNAKVNALTLWGNNLYVGGDFTNVYDGATPIPEADYVALWDGSIWSALSSDGAGNGSLNAGVFALNVDENYVYVGGSFTNVNNSGVVLNAADYIAQFNLNNGQWESIGSDNTGNGSLNNAVTAIDINDYGLYVGGAFFDVKNPGGILANADYIAHWNGGGWEGISSNGAGDGSLNGIVHTLAHKGFGVGTVMYVGGDFTDVKYGITTLTNADYIAQLTPSSNTWSTVPGAPTLNGSVWSISLSGNTIVLGGTFTNLNGIPEADYIATWDGSAWSALGGNGSSDGSLNQVVRAVGIKAGNIYAGGSFTDVNDDGSTLYDSDNFSIWNGSSWSGGAGPDGSFRDSSMRTVATMSTDVYFGGSTVAPISNSTYLTGDALFRWDGFNWNNLGSGNGLDINSSVSAIAVQGVNIYVTGNFLNAGGVPGANTIAKWDGNAWSALGGSGAVSGVGYALAAVGTDIYVGGDFVNVAGIPQADYLAKWDGNSWSAVGNTSALNNPVYALAANGANLYVGGEFTDVNGIANADYLVKWNGLAWSALGDNGSGQAALNFSVSALTFNGSDLYAGGGFTNAGGNPNADYIAKWDGTTWSALGTGLSGPVYALDTDNTDVYAGGSFINAGGNPETDYVARWDGNTWSALGSNGAGNGSLNGPVNGLKVANGKVYVTGLFTNISNKGNILNNADYVAAFEINLPPQVLSITRASANPSSAATVEYTVTFSEAVTGVDVSDFTISSSGLTGDNVDNVVPITGSIYTVVVNTGTGDGTLQLNIPANATITDSGGNPPSNLPFTNSEVYTIAKTAPAVTSITRTSGNPTNASNVDFLVTFTKTVTGVDTADFSLTKTGNISGEGIANVSGSGATRTVTVNTGTGTGALRLDIPNGATISDGANNLVGLPYTSGQTYSVRTQTFGDVPISYWSWQFIERLYSAGVTGGCSNSPMLYCPATTVTRDQMAVFLLRGEHGSAYAPPAATGSMFVDVPQNYWAAAWIEQLANEGITGGCGGGKYCPTAPVTRDQMAVFLLRGEHGGGYTPPAATGAMFADVPQNYWAAAWIEQLANEGITGGCGGGNYCPSVTVTRDQMAVFLVRTFGLP